MHIHRHRPPAGPATGRLPRNSEGNRLTSLSLELHVNTRGDLRPDPARDTVSNVCVSQREVVYGEPAD